MASLEPEFERDAVAKGARLLDKILPGWHNQIDLKKLNMENAQLCMMGQLFGQEVEGQLAREMYPKETSKAKAVYDSVIGHFYGYHLAMVTIPYRGKPTTPLIDQLVAKHDLSSHEDWSELQALKHVCFGHNNKCLWADEIATRIAKESDGKEPLSK